MPWLIGDSHGCFKTLDAMIKRNQDIYPDNIVLAGDLINRGPLSLEILDIVERGRPFLQSLMGNHELGYLAWRALPFKEGPFDSFSSIAKQDVDNKYAKLIQSFPFVYATDTVLFTHAGLYPFWSLEENLLRAQQLHEFLRNLEDLHIFLDIYKRPIIHPAMIHDEFDLWAFCFNVFTPFDMAILVSP